MRAIASMLIALSIVATLAAPAATAAAVPTIKKKHSVKAHPRAQAYRGEPTRAGSAPTYQENIADKRPIGTTSWWEQMDREGRGGQSNNN